MKTTSLGAVTCPSTSARTNTRLDGSLVWASAEKTIARFVSSSGATNVADILGMLTKAGAAVGSQVAPPDGPVTRSTRTSTVPRGNDMGTGAAPATVAAIPASVASNAAASERAPRPAGLNEDIAVPPSPGTGRCGRRVLRASEA